MGIDIKPWKSGDSGYGCLPLAKNIHVYHAPETVRRMHPDWKLAACPVCGNECYESDLARLMKERGLKMACTNCALRMR